MPVSSLKTPYWTALGPLAPGQRVRYSASAFPALGPGRRFALFRANDFFHTVRYFEAAVIRFRPVVLLATQVAPTAVLCL